MRMRRIGLSAFLGGGREGDPGDAPDDEAEWIDHDDFGGDAAGEASDDDEGYRLGDDDVARDS